MREKKIIEVLEKNPQGLKVVEIAKKIKYSKIPVGVLCSTLEIRGLIIKRIAGSSKIFYDPKHWNGDKK